MLISKTNNIICRDMLINVKQKKRQIKMTCLQKNNYCYNELP